MLKIIGERIAATVADGAVAPQSRSSVDFPAIFLGEKEACTDSSAGTS